MEICSARRSFCCRRVLTWRAADEREDEAGLAGRAGSRPAASSSAGAVDVAFVNRLVAEHPEASRRALSRKLWEARGWVHPSTTISASARSGRRSSTALSPKCSARTRQSPPSLLNGRLQVCRKDPVNEGTGDQACSALPPGCESSASTVSIRYPTLRTVIMHAPAGPSFSRRRPM